MNRKRFLQTISFLPLSLSAMRISDFASSASTARMPVLFLGHGSPMNAIEDNEFVQGFRKAAKEIPKPVSILCISAHWETKGTQITAMEHPKTIHDFGGFPKALFDVQYPAPGSPALATSIQHHLEPKPIGLDTSWGLDHGAWSVIKHLYPEANIPVLQCSLDYTKTPAEHYALARELSWLRKQGVLIVGSGNMVHNLGMVAWDKLNEPGFGFEWALEANQKMKQFINHHDHQSLIGFRAQGKSFDLAIPTPEHYLPMLYILALQEEGEQVRYFNDKAVAGSLSMTSFSIS
jgi:4,5-DOPA dioxygenase extradiol